MTPTAGVTLQTAIEGRVATFLVNGREVVCVEVALASARDRVDARALRNAIDAAGLVCGVSPHVMWEEGGAGLDGVWRGTVAFHAYGWRPKPLSIRC